MRIIIAGERTWDSKPMAEHVIKKLIARHGRVTIITRGGPGLDQAFSIACWKLGAESKCVLPDYAHAGDSRFQNREIIFRGATFASSFIATSLMRPARTW
jgi:hypothetical protein